MKGLVHWWKMNDIVQFAANDSISVDNGELYRANVHLLPKFVRDGPLNAAVSFHSESLKNGNYINIECSVLPKQPLCVSFWVSPDEIQTEKAGILGWTDDNYEGFAIRKAFGSNSYYCCFGTGRNWVNVADPRYFELKSNQWQHVSVNIDLDKIIVFVDALKKCQLEIGGQVLRPSYCFEIGCSGYEQDDQSNWYFSGAVADVRIYNRVLSGVEILQIFSDFSPICRFVNTFDREASILLKKITLNCTLKDVYKSIEGELRSLKKPNPSDLSKKLANAIRVQSQFKNDEDQVAILRYAVGRYKEIIMRL